jgi:hypothetical protein
MKSVKLLLLAMFALLIPALAIAQEAPVLPTPDDLGMFAQAVLAAFSAHNWGLVTALVLIGLVWAARKWGGKLWPFLLTDRGGALLSLVGGLALSIAAAATAPTAGSVWAVLGAGLLMTVTASGTYSLLRKLLFPSGADAVAEVDANVAKLPTPSGAAATADMINRELDR